MTKQVTFICKTCEYRNENQLGMPGFDPVNTEYESLTEAMEHLMATRLNPQDSTHDIIAVFEEQDAKAK